MLRNVHTFFRVIFCLAHFQAGVVFTLAHQRREEQGEKFQRKKVMNEDSETFLCLNLATAPGQNFHPQVFFVEPPPKKMRAPIIPLLFPSLPKKIICPLRPSPKKKPNKIILGTSPSSQFAIRIGELENFISQQCRRRRKLRSTYRVCLFFFSFSFAPCGMDGLRCSPFPPTLSSPCSIAAAGD